MRRRPQGKKQAKLVITRLMAEYGIPDTTLNDREDPWRLLVAAILAAQCTDERVNKVTPFLWADYPEMEDIAGASPEAIEPYVKSCGLYRNKAKNIYLAANFLLEHHGGVVPDTLEELLEVPGVGRKIANLLLGDIFGQEAIVVDTHCKRISKLLGLTNAEDPYRVERDLERYVPEEHWTDWGHFMVTHGRAVCKARSPECPHCVLIEICREGRKRYPALAQAREDDEALE